MRDSTPGRASPPSQTSDKPLVTILTPVYNGAGFLSECIESVLGQDYQNWEYIIVNNRSTDATLEIAQQYAAKDSRIRVATNEKFLSMPANFNHAFGMVSEASGYVKVVCADDWILPSCLSKMVGFAVKHPSVGVLCCHQRSGNHVRWRELPPSTATIDGVEACRLALLKGAQIFGAPTAFLYRADLMRSGRPFFPTDHPYSDTSACYEALSHCDYGVVHEILAVERVHDEQITFKIEQYIGDTPYLDVFLHYGPRYLAAQEFEERRREVFESFYQGLGTSLLKLRGRAYWTFQKEKLQEMGCKLEWSKVLLAAFHRLIGEARSPGTAMKRLRSVTGPKEKP